MRPPPLPLHLLLSLACLLGLTPTDLCAGDPTVRLRLEWSNSQETIWTGRIESDRGQLHPVVAQDDRAEKAGTCWRQGEALQIERRIPAAVDVCEFELTAPLESVLRIRIQDATAEGDDESIEASLSGIIQKPQIFEAAAARPRLTISRAEEDVLSVQTDRESPLFESGEMLRGTIRLNLLAPRISSEQKVRVHLRWKLQAESAWRSIAEGSSTVTARLNSEQPTQVPLELPLPESENVYLLRISATGRGFEDIEYSVPIVVVGKISRAPRASSTERMVDSFEPRRAGALRRVTALSPGGRSDDRISRWITRSRNGKPPDATGTTHWSAYKLKVSHPNKPHRLTVHCERGNDSAWGLAILEGPDLQTVAAVVQFAQLTGRLERELLFWPTTREPTVVLFSERDAKPPDLDSVKLHELGERLEGIGPASEPTANSEQVARRLIGPYFDVRSLRAMFNAGPPSSSSNEPLREAWAGALLASDRLSQWLRWSAANAALVAVPPESLTGSNALLESATLDGAVRLNPHSADLLELLLRVFDGEDLALIPELQFTDPLAPLLDLQRLGGASGWELVDFEGRVIEAALGIPQYNPLDPRVQQAVADLLTGFLEKYGHHRALAGIALSLGPQGYLQLPGLSFGYDEATLARFARATGVKVPPAHDEETRERRFEFLTTRARNEWIRWRVAEITRFHRRLAEIVAATRPGTQVLFSGQPLLDEGNQLIPSIETFVRQGISPVSLLQQRGLDMANIPYEVASPLRPMLRGAAGDPLSQAVLRTFNENHSIDAAWRSASRGTLVLSLPVDVSLLNIDGHQALRPVATHCMPSPEDTERTLTRALGVLDSQVVFAGGDGVPLSVDLPTRRFQRVFQQLPAVPFEASSKAPQPLVLRHGRAEGATWLSAVNESSLPITCEITVTAARDVSIFDIERRVEIPAARISGGSRRVSLSLSAFDFACVRINSPTAAVAEVTVIPSPQSLVQLEQRVNRLNRQMGSVANLARPSDISVRNAGFEESASKASQPPGWEVPQDATARCSLDTSAPRSGKTSLRLIAEGNRPELVSPELPLEGARHATLSLWMRSSRTGANVRLTAEAEFDGRPWRQELTCQVDKEWKRCELRLSNIPAGTCQGARLRVEPMENCRLWLDDLDVSTQPLAPDEARQLSKTLSAVRVAWDQGRYADCQRMLDGYWGQFLPEETSPAIRQAEKPGLGTRVKQIFRR